MKSKIIREEAGFIHENVHYWKPPCSCGVELDKAVEMKRTGKIKGRGEVHFWKPPCSCGIHLKEVVK